MLPLTLMWLAAVVRRTSLQLAELEREGGISPRVSPMTSKPSHRFATFDRLCLNV